MPVRSITVAALSLVLSVASAGCCTANAPGGACSAHPPQAAAAPADTQPNASKTSARPPQERHLYRLDVTMSSGEAGNPGGGVYTLNLEEERNGEIRLGANIPLQKNLPAGASSPRQDVGLMLRFVYTLAGEDLLLHSITEMSSSDEASTIRKLSINGDALISPGKPTLVTSIEEPAGHKRYQLTVTATKLR